jgi:Tfp pilus assembly protein PilN
MQQINFLHGLRKPTTKVPLWVLGSMMIAVLFVLAIMTVTMLINLYSTYSNLNTTKKHYETIDQAYVKLATQYPLLVNQVPLIQQFNALENRYKAKLAELEALKHYIVRPGFSTYMLSLAKVTPDSLWLNQINIDHGQSKFTLSGYALNPDSVPALMEKLQHINAFEPVLFSSFSVNAVKNKSYVGFSISTHDLAISADDNNASQIKQVNTAATE